MHSLKKQRALSNGTYKAKQNFHRFASLGRSKAATTLQIANFIEAKFLKEIPVRDFQSVDLGTFATDKTAGNVESVKSFLKGFDYTFESEENTEKDLENFLNQLDRASLRGLSKFILEDNLDILLVANLLRVLGSSKNLSNLAERQEILKKCMESKNASIRHSAAIALGLMQTKEANSVLEHAFEVETNKMLLKLITRLLKR